MLESQDTPKPKFHVGQYVKHKKYHFCVRKVISIDLKNECDYKQLDEPKFVYGFFEDDKKETGENYQALPDFDLDSLEEWICPDGYSFSAWKTYQSKLFSLRSGEHVSILSLSGGISDSSEVIHLKGPVFIGSDNACWKIINKFNLFDSVIEKVIEAGDYSPPCRVRLLIS